YIVGRPVSGSDFYGRAELMARLYEGPEWATWLIGGRRMGKTSILYQLRYYTLNDPGKVAIFCNWQPAQSMNDLKTILLERIESNADGPITSKLHISAKTLEDLSLYHILSRLIQQAQQHNICVFLLIDEPED